MKKQEMRAAAREHVVGVLSFARDMNRGYTAETWTSDRACARNDQRVRHFERASGAIQALYIAGLLTTASASRSARLLGAYSFDDEWADMDRRACFDKMDEAKLEVW